MSDLKNNALGQPERLTNEEAINELLQCYSLYSPFKTAKKTNEAISMAIAALEGKDTNVGDTISRQAAIDALSYCQTYLFDSRDDDKKISLEDAEYAIEQLPSAQPEQSTEPCEFCRNHEKGNTLYESSTWDGGIGFDYIDNIKFCPICGRELQDG